MRLRQTLQNSLMVATAGLFVGAPFIPGSQQSGPVLRAAVSVVTAKLDTVGQAMPSNPVMVQATAALTALQSHVRKLSHPAALESAFRGYFAFKSAHSDEVKKPYLYFVDYGLPSTEPRGYVFDMETLAIVDGPFMVAHGRGSSPTREGVPTRFSNASGSNATSLGLYLTQETYGFVGHSAGSTYSSVGLRLLGLSRGWNDKARDRGVVAHGAPYVTSDKAGRSEGCPALEPGRAQRLLPKIANGALVFLFAPDADWMSHDPWVASAGNAAN
jgi:L,D-transpeptidase-like protein